MKRFIHRAKEGISEKFGKSERTIDEEYDNLYRRFEQVTNASVNYQKHVQQFVENFHSMTTTMTFIAEDMTDLFKNQNSREQEVARKLMDAAQECETNAVKPFVCDYFLTINTISKSKLYQV
jgi:DNA anti-recombination protein RmuC